MDSCSNYVIKKKTAVIPDETVRHVKGKEGPLSSKVNVYR